MLKAKYSIRYLLLVSAILLLPLTAKAELISADVTISGSVLFNADDSYADFTDQGGFISSIVGGSATQSDIDSAVILGTNPLAGVLTDIGDGFGSSFFIDGFDDDAAGALFSDYEFSLENNSATDQYLISLTVDFLSLADADGSDATLGLLFYLENITVGDEFFFTELVSDIPFGDIKNDASLASSGASLSDDGVITFDFILNPLATLDIIGFNGIEGGEFDTLSSFSGELTSFISVSAVTNLTNPTAVPEPASIALLALGLFGLGFARKRET